MPFKFDTLVFDLDGTLLSSAEPLASLNDFFYTLSISDYDVIVCTARPLSSIIKQPWARLLSYIIPYNGICLYDVKRRQANNIITLPLSVSSVGEFGRIYMTPYECVVCSSGHQMAHFKRSDTTRPVVLATDFKFDDGPASLLSYCGVTSEIEKLRWVVDSVPTKRLVKVYQYEETRFGRGLSWLEIVPAESSKGAQFGSLARDGVTFGAGNGWNDVSFLEMCNFTICPADADRPVAQTCDEVSEHCAGPNFREHILNRLDGGR